MFSFFFFFNLSAMDSHSKREVLEMFNINEKIVIAWFLSLNSLPIFQLFKIFRKKIWSRDISRDLSTQHLYFMLKTMSFFMGTKFWYPSILFTEVIANKSTWE